MMNKEMLLLSQCRDIFQEFRFRTTPYSSDLERFGFRFETQFDEKENIHGSVIIDRKDITIATSATYRTIEETIQFIKRLQEALNCCKKVKSLLE